MNRRAMIWRPAPRGPILGVWPKQRMRPIWQYPRFDPRFDTDWPRERARLMLGKRRRHRPKPYSAKRRAQMAYWHYMLTRVWRRWHVVAVYDIRVTAKKGIMSC